MNTQAAARAAVEQSAAAFAAEFSYWREVRGLSKRALAKGMGCTAAYVGHLESGRHRPSEELARRADRALHAGGAVERRWHEYHAAVARTLGSTAGESAPASAPGAPPYAPNEAAPAAARGGRPHAVPGVQPYASGFALVAEHDGARLDYDGATYQLHMRRRLRNIGTEPITRYLIRISVDRYPGEPERSRAHYRAHPLTWEALALTAHCADRPMRLETRHDRDAFKEVWLLFEDGDGEFALRPGESACIDYTYRVSDVQWGHWFQRAVRVPTKRLEIRLALPRDLDPVLWCTETSAGAGQTPSRTAPRHHDEGPSRVFDWSTATPPLHARYRLEWHFRAAPTLPPPRTAP